MSNPFIPPPGASVKVSIIDTGGRMGPGIPTGLVMHPPWSGFDSLKAIPTWVFLVENSQGRKLLFDLGLPKDIGSFSPAIQKGLRLAPWEIIHPTDTADVLSKHGVNLDDVKDVVWSHHHPDHIGNINTFPKTTSIVVGPGFREAFMPAFPSDPKSELREGYFEGRELHEIDFSHPTLCSKIGSFRAHDFFGDGSFYILDTPGHDHGHISGLARTTVSADGESAKDTFILMGGDLCHHPASLRPSPQLPLSGQSSMRYESSIPSVCPGHIISKIQQKQKARGHRAEDEPIFKPAPAVDMDAMTSTISHTQICDGMDNIFVIAAHDTSIADRISLFPENANGWFQKGWKWDTVWKFLEE